MSKLQQKTPESVKDLMEALKRVPIESPEYQKRIDEVYAKYLEQSVNDVDNLLLGKNVRRDAIAALLGINYNCQMSHRGKSARVTHRITAANAGEVRLLAKVAGSQLEKVLTAGENRNSQRFRQNIKSDDPRAQFTGMTELRWKGVKLEYHYVLESSDGIRGKWSRNPSDTVYGPFPAVVEKARQNGAFQVRMAGDVLFECSLMGNTEVVQSGKETQQYAEWRKAMKGDFKPGTKVLFSYFNRGGNTFTPMTDSIQILTH